MTSKPDRLIIRTWADPFPAAFLEAAGDGFTDRTGIPLEFDHTAMTGGHFTALEQPEGFVADVRATFAMLR